MERSGGDSDQVRGPHAWLNWYAQRAGAPRREATHPDSVVSHPIWEEFALYTDAQIGGSWLSLGPYEVIDLMPVAEPRLGLARRSLLLRGWDHLSDAPLDSKRSLRDDVETYYGGDIGDEIAALLGLALGRRIRSGGPIRKGLPGVQHDIGLPTESEHHAPVLEPPRKTPQIPWVADPIELTHAEPLLASYPLLKPADAVALVRAALQYVDGLWMADADPRIAWIKLIGSLEVVANRVDEKREESAMERLKRHRRRLHKELEKAPPEVAEFVAEEVAPFFNVERKLRSFVKRFDPGPPERRPIPAYQFGWAGLDEAVGTIYGHRSRDLHDGIAFPWVLCEPPDVFDDALVPSERFWALGVSGRGGQWTAEALPMYLHVFAHVAGGALRNWWRSLTSPEV